MAGFAEEAKLIFMSTNAGIFVIDFRFGGVRKVCHHNFSFHLLVPIVSLGCELGAPLSEYHYPPPSPTCSELEEEEELLERAQQMFIKGSKSIEERNFVDAVECLSQALENSVALYGERASQCASTYLRYGYALLRKAQEVPDTFGNVSKSSPDEESVKSTTSKADAQSSKASGANVEDAPSLKEGGGKGEQKSNGKIQEGRNGDGEKADDKMAGDENGSCLNLAWKMLGTAREIYQKSKGNPTMNLKILSAIDGLMKGVASQATVQQIAGNAVPRTACLTSSQMARLMNSFDSPIMSTSATKSAGNTVTGLGVVARGIKRANIKPISAEPSPKRSAADHSPVEAEGAPSLEEGDTEEGKNSNVKAHKDRNGDGDKVHDEIARDEDDSDLNLALKMSGTPRAIFEKSQATL